MIVRPAHPAEYDAVLELIRQALPTDDRAVHAVAATIQHDPQFRPEHLRVAEQDGRIVGAINIISRLVRLGVAQARCAIIAPLAALPDQQGSNAGVALLRDTVEWATNQEFQLSLLWDQAWLYPPYGYAPTLKRYQVIVPAGLRPSNDAAYTIRPYQPADAPALLHVYQTETEPATIAEVRSDQPWEWRPRDSQTIIEVAVDPARTIRGYLRATPVADRLRVGEIMAMDAGAAQALYDRLLFLAREHGAAVIVADAPPDSRWSKLAFARAAEIRIRPGNGAGMLRVLDPRGLLRALQPEFERRVARSEFVAKRADVRIETPAGRATIRIDQGRVEVSDARVADSVTLPFHALGPLISGYQSGSEVLGLPGVFMYGSSATRLLDVLFPAGTPHWLYAAYLS